MSWWQWTLINLGAVAGLLIWAFLWMVHDYCDNGN